MSFWSRLASWLRGSRPPATPIAPAPAPLPEPAAPPEPEPLRAPAPGPSPSPSPAVAAEPELAREAPRDDWRQRAAEDAARVETLSRIRIGIDFGTSTTQVAYRLGSSEPRMLRLEPATDHMPSYFAIDTTGQHLFGAEAVNYAENVHSIKLRLQEDLPMLELGGMKPSQVAYLMIEEVVRRTVRHLRAQRAIPADAESLEVATSLGCTPRFTLEQRLRLRDVAQLAGLNVRLADLVEEPVAAAFELVRSAAAPEGPLLVIDVGGGTMDIAIVKADLGARRIDLYATSGHELGGDQYTSAIVRRIYQAVEERTGSAVSLRRDETLAWRRAETAKLTLSVQDRAIVPLGGIAGIENEDLELDRAWFDKETLHFVEETRRQVLNTYWVARLVLDRGGEDDPAPGSIYFHEGADGSRIRITQVGLEDDGVKHLAGVVMVGGASQTPALHARFRRIFGEKLLDPRDLDVDPVDAVALGLAQGESIMTANRRFPNWGVSAVFTGSADVEVPLYEPFSPTFKLRAGTTSVYEVTVPVPPEAQHSVALAFRPVADGDGRRWAAHRLADGANAVTFGIDLFGEVMFTDSCSRSLVPAGSRVPWAPIEADARADWIPPSKRKLPEWFDPSGWRDDTK